MIGRRVRTLHPDALARLSSCGAPGSVPRAGDQAWACAAAEQWGMCGLALVHNDHVVAHALVCPTLNLPPDHPLARWSRSPESAALIELHRTDWAPDDAEKVLVQSLAARLEGRVGGLEAAGALGRPNCHQPTCTWLEEVGFLPVPGAASPTGRRMRLDLASTVIWRPGLRGAWRAVHTLVERPLGAEPTGRGQH